MARIPVTTFLLLTLVLMHSLGFAQTKEQGMALLREAYELHKSAKTNHDLERVAAKYREALAVFEKVGFDGGIAATEIELGDVFFAMRKYEEAIDCWQKCLRIFEAVKFDEQIEELTSKLGKVYFTLGKYDRALECFEKLLKFSKDHNDWRGQADALINLGAVYHTRGMFDWALKHFEEALKISKDHHAAREEVYALNSLGRVCKDLGQNVKALEHFEEALKISKDLNDPSGQADALNNLGDVYKARGLYDRAVQHFEKALQISTALNDPSGQADALNNLGNVYKAWGLYDRAVEHFEEALKISKDLDDPIGQASTLINLGNVYAQSGEYQRALEHYKKALKISTDLKVPSREGMALNNLAVVYCVRGQYDKAVEHHSKALKISTELKDPSGEAMTLNNLGNVYKAWGHFDKALEKFEEALKIEKDLNDLRGTGKIVLNIGMVYAQKGDQNSLEKSLEKLLEGLKIYQEIGIPDDYPKTLIGDLYLDWSELDASKIDQAEPFLKEAGYSASLGRLHYLKSDYQRAKYYYEELLQSAEQNRNANNLFTAYTGLGLAYEGLGQDPKAEEYFRKAVDYTEELRSGLPPSEREKFFHVRVEGFFRTAPYEGLARVLWRMGRPLEAFKTSEETKARVFAELMSRGPDTDRSDIPAEVAKKGRELEDRLAALKKKRQTAYEESHQEVIAVIEPQVQEMEGKLETYKKMLRKKYPLFAATKYPEPTGLDESALGPDEWVLSYHVTDPGIIIYLTKGKKLVKALFKPIPRKELDETILKFRKPLEMEHLFSLAKLKSFDLVSGKKLFGYLLRDIVDYLPDKQPVIIVPDGLLGILPFEMLVTNSAGKIIDNGKGCEVHAEFFGDRNPILYVQSVNALTLARIYGRHQRLSDEVLIIADPVYQGRWYRLQKTATLADKLVEIYGEKAEKLTQLDASKEKLLKEFKPVLDHFYRIIFAGHGCYGADCPEPALVFSMVPRGTDCYLRMSEIMGLKMNADLVALTACQTGLGERLSGEGTMAMSRAFQYAGARTVVSSLWEVDLNATVELMQDFFSYINQGKPKLEALRMARHNLRNNGYDHPFYWAAFILAGESK